MTLTLLRFNVLVFKSLIYTELLDFTDSSFYSPQYILIFFLKTAQRYVVVYK